MTNLPDNLPDLLRKHGLNVKTIDGWRYRGRPASTGGFSPVGVLCHHTATPKSSSVDAVNHLLVVGRSDLPGPLCHLSLGRDGTVYVIAAGRANHAGVAKASGTVAAGDGNELYIGIEAMNDGVGEPWPDAQFNAYVLLCAALCVEITKNSYKTVRAHKETSVTGKVDPRFDMNVFREKVAAKIEELKSPTTTVLTRGEKVDHAIADLESATGTGDRLLHIQEALAALKQIEAFPQTR